MPNQLLFPTTTDPTTMKTIPTQSIVTLSICTTLSLCGLGLGSAQTVLIDFGSNSTYRGVTTSSPDTNGNHWNSSGFGFISNLLDSGGDPTTIDWAPDGLGGVDSFNSIAGATSDPVSNGEITAVQTALDGGSLGDFAIAEVAIDYYVSNNSTSNVGRFQLQQVTAGELYDLTFYGARQFTGTDIQTTYSVFDDSSYSNLLGSVILDHGDGGGNANISNVGMISGLEGPSNANNVFYIQWEGAINSTAGYINAMSISLVPEPRAYALISGLMAFGWIGTRRRCQV